MGAFLCVAWRTLFAVCRLVKACGESRPSGARSNRSEPRDRQRAAGSELSLAENVVRIAMHTADWALLVPRGAHVLKFAAEDGFWRSFAVTRNSAKTERRISVRPASAS